MSHSQLHMEAMYLQGYASLSSEPDEAGSVSETSSSIESSWLSTALLSKAECKAGCETCHSTIHVGLDHHLVESVRMV